MSGVLKPIILKLIRIINNIIPHVIANFGQLWQLFYNGTQTPRVKSDALETYLLS